MDIWLHDVSILICHAKSAIVQTYFYPVGIVSYVAITYCMCKVNNGRSNFTIFVSNKSKNNTTHPDISTTHTNSIFVYRILGLRHTTVIHFVNQNMNYLFCATPTHRQCIIYNHLKKLLLQMACNWLYQLIYSFTFKVKIVTPWTCQRR